MSTLNSVLPATTVAGATQSVTNPNGFQSLTPSDFIQMMVTQLENQDPLDPTNSQDILSQMSEIGSLQSSTQLQTTLTGLTLQNQIGSASSLIGKTVQGTDSNNNPLTGTVSSVSITPASTTASGSTAATVNLNLSSGSTMPLANVTSIAAAPVTMAQAAAAALSNATSTGATTGTPTTTSTTGAATGLPGALASLI
jgi:flagellar basal-body rod modification protein FlgD